MEIKGNEQWMVAYNKFQVNCKLTTFYSHTLLKLKGLNYKWQLKILTVLNSKLINISWTNGEKQLKSPS